MLSKELLIKAKTAAALLVVVLLLFIAGCSLWPFGKADSAEEALKLKNQTDKIYNTVQANAGKLSTFLKKLDKRWYTAKDVQNFSNELNDFENQIQQDSSNLQQINSNLNKLAQLDEKKQFAEFIEAKTKASKSLEKSLANSKKIVSALNPKMVNIAKLYAESDQVKQVQSQYITALGVGDSRQVQAALSRTLLSAVLNPPAPAASTTDTTEDAATSDSGSGDTTDSTTDTTTDTTTGGSTTGETTTDTSATTATDTSSDLDPWVYQVAKNEWPSNYLKDFIEKTTEDFNSSYQNLYEIHQQVKFANSRKLLNNLQQIKTDNADFAASIGAIIDNLKEQKRLTKLRDKYNSMLAIYQASHDAYTDLQKNRPAGVSAGSVASNGMAFGHELSHSEISRYKSKVNGLNSRIKTLKSALSGSLQTDWEDAAWRFRGSLLALYKINISISKDLTKETKQWKSKAITKYVYYRLQHLAEAKLASR